MSENEKQDEMSYTPERGEMVRYIGPRLDLVDHHLRPGDKGIYCGISHPSGGKDGSVAWMLQHGVIPHIVKKLGKEIMVNPKYLEPVGEYDMCEPGGGWENCEWQPPKETS